VTGPRAAPPPDELAAIVAAVELGWPRPAPPGPAGTRTGIRSAPAWRFSGRWWDAPVVLRRARPWIP